MLPTKQPTSSTWQRALRTSHCFKSRTRSGENACHRRNPYVACSQDLLQGLRANWEKLHKTYLNLPVMCDTRSKILRRNKMEADLSQLEVVYLPYEGGSNRCLRLILRCLRTTLSSTSTSRPDEGSVPCSVCVMNSFIKLITLTWFNHLTRYDLFTVLRKHKSYFSNTLTSTSARKEVNVL